MKLFAVFFQTIFEKDEPVDVPVKKPEQPAYKPAVYDTAELEEELGLVRRDQNSFKMLR